MKFHILSIILSVILLPATSLAQNVDVAVNITSIPTVVPGGSITYSVYITNNGPANAANVTVRIPAVSNFTANSVTCASGAGNDGSASCPASVTIAALQGSGVVIPSLPYGSAVVFTVTGTASATPAQISLGATAFVASPYADVSAGNNTLTVNTRVGAADNCGQTTYTLNPTQTVAQNTVAINGGTLNLVYTLTSGTAIPALGSSFTVPVAYSDLNNAYGTDNQWASLRVENAHLVLGMNTTDGGTGSIYNGLPGANSSPSSWSFSGALILDKVVTGFLADNTLEPIGGFTLNIGSLPGLPSNVYVASEGLLMESNTTANYGGNSMHSGYWLKPMIVHTATGGTTATALTPQVEMEGGQIYNWRYTAFRGSLAGITDISRGMVFKNSSTITFATVPVAVDDAYSVAENGTVTLTPLDNDVASNCSPLTITRINGTTLTGAAQSIAVTNGTVNINAGGAISFNPTANYSGLVSFPYTISGGSGGTATATMYIVVNPGTCKISATNPDSDADGVADVCDADDDNDGILDINECATQTNTVIADWLNNSSAFLGTVGAAYTTHVTAANSSAGSGLTRTHYASQSYQLITNVDATSEATAYMNNEYVEYAVTVSKPLGVNQIRYYAAAHDNTQYYYFLRVSSDNFASNIVVHGQTLLVPNNGNTTITLPNTLHLLAGNTYKFRVYFYSPVGGSGADFAHDDFTLLGFADCDTDGDNSPNRLDVDSDGDGCPDVIEGGANFQPGASYITGNRLNTTVNASGVPAVPASTTGYSQAAGQTVNQAQTVNTAAVGGTASASQSIPSGNAPSALTLSGHTGSIQWQVSTDNITFTDIAAATGTTLSPGILIATRYYRALISNVGGCTAASSVVTITVTAGPCTITASNPDSDGDGFADDCDLDDDNDGILDSAEGVCAPATVLSTTGWKAVVYDAPTPTAGYTEVSAASGFPTASFSQVATFDYNEFNNTANAFNIRFVENGVRNSSAIIGPGHSDITNYTGTAIAMANEDYAIAFNKTITSTDEGTYRFTLEFGDDHIFIYKNGVKLNQRENAWNTGSGPLPVNNFATISVVAGDVITVLVVEENSTGTEVAITAVKTAGACLLSDTDGDGILNRLDLDSDGDGCPDAIEGGAAFTAADLTTASGTLTAQTPNRNLGNTVGNTSSTLGVPVIAGTGQSIGSAATANPVLVVGTAGSNQIILSGNSPANLALTGSTGSIQWQVSTDNNTFTNISGATNATLAPGALTATRYYRAVVSSVGGCTANSNVVTISINNNPSAVNDSYPMAEDGSAIPLTPLSNDSDPDGNTLTITSINSVALTGAAQSITVSNGTVNITAGGAISFTPVSNYNGSVNFPYAISDGIGGTASGTITINVSPVNDAPVAVTDNYSVAEDGSVTLTPLANDTDVDGNPLSITRINGINRTVGIVQAIAVTNGTVNITAAGAISFTPTTNYNGAVSFSYRISDGALTADGTINITVTAVNDAPVAVTDSYSVNEDGTVTLTPLSNDTDVEGNTLTITRINGINRTVGIVQAIAVTNGTVNITAAGAISFTPTANYNGPVSFPYTISDGALTADGTINITVNAVNDAPVAVTDDYSVNEGGTVTLNPLGNDTDVDGDVLTITRINGTNRTAGVAQAIAVTNGIVNITAGGAISFSAAANYNGSVSFSYVISDGIATATANININVIVVLPVELLYFTASKTSANSVLFTWATAMEQNNKGFAIEHSADGQTWNTLGFVNTKSYDGNSNAELHYTFEDKRPSAGKNYYRLKQIDFDGKYDYSVVRIVQIVKGSIVKLFPNPATNIVTVSGVNRGETIHLYTINGQKLGQGTVSSPTQVIDVSNVSNGIYNLVVADAGGKMISVHKLIKQAAR